MDLFSFFRANAFIKSSIKVSFSKSLANRVSLQQIAFIFVLIAVSVLIEFYGAAGVAYGAECATPGKDGPATISGIVNTYYPGDSTVARGYTLGVLPAGSTSIPVGAIRVTVPAGTAIASGDLLLVIQMQDADINSSNNATYGDGLNAGSGYTALNQAGLYEYVIATGPVAAGLIPIQGSGPGNGLANSYRTRAYAAGLNGQSTFQVIRVPQYSAATVAAATAVTAAAWNGSTGGVVVMDVAGTLTIDGTITVDGLGFRGGMGRQHGGNVTYANTDYRQFSAPNLGIAQTGAHAGKGEGIAGTPRYVNQPATFNGAPAQTDTGVEGYPNGSYGRGAPGNAGGGGTDGRPNAAPPSGNDENSGGGGGANYGWGGKGGNSWNSNIIVGGEGGSYVTGLAYNRVVMGGGGGAGTTNNGTGENFTFTNPLGLACNGAVYTTGQCSSGAPGGGIIILRTKLFSGSGLVTAEGGDAYNVGNDSAGGGGAGGSIVLDSQIGGVVTSSVRGGDGGNAWRNGGTTLADRHGPGGGGGGGFVVYSPIDGLVVLATVAGGINGKTTTLADYYGTTSSDGGIKIFENPTVSGPKSAAACLPALTVSKSTTTPTISGLPGTAAYTISVTNDTGKSTAQQVSISDTLPGVPALFTNASAAPTITYSPNTAPCNTSRTSTSNAPVGTSTPSWSSWDIPPDCTINLTFNAAVPSGTVPSTYQNPATATFLDPERTTSVGTKSITYNPSSSTAEDVSLIAPPSVSKAFVSSVINPGASSTVVVTLSNPNSSPITGAGFTDALPAPSQGAPGYMVLINPPAPSTTCGGTPSYTAIDSSHSFSVSGLSIPANSSCQVSFTVTAVNEGIYVNIIPAGAVSSSAGSNTNPASASLTVGSGLLPPTMTKTFTTNPVLIGATTTLTFTLTNPNATAIGSAGFIDTLPTEIVIAAVPNVINTCGGTVTAAAGTNYISLNTNGTIPASSSCTVFVDLTGRSAGLYQNTSGQVVGDTGAGNRASADLRVMAPIVVSKSFDTNPVARNTATVMRIKLTNPNSINVTGAAFTDTYPSGLVNTATPNAATTCLGSPTITAAAGGSSLAVGGTGATITANSSCFVTVNVQASSSGSYTNSTGTVSTTNAGNAPSASSTLNVLSPPLVRKVFSPDIISNGGRSGMQIIISNPSSNVAPLTGVALSDTYTGNMTNADAGTLLCTDGSSATLTGGVPSGTTVGISGGSILPGGSCMITQLVTAATNNTNTTSAPTSVNAGTGVAATAVLKVMQPLLVSKSFSNSRPAVNTDVTMTIRFTNPNPDIVKNIAFTDTYPANMVNSPAPAPTFTPANCMGSNATLTAAAGGSSLSLSSSVMFANTTCDITVLVRLNANNISRINSTGTVTTANAGTSPGDSATIATGTGVSPVELSKTFGSSTINAGQTTALVFTIRNPNTAAGTGATAMAFTDALPAGLVISTPNGLANNCGGTVTAPAGGSTITLANGTLALNSTCTITVNVTGSAAGSYVNLTGQIQATISAATRLGNYAEATIQVQNPPSVSKSFGSSYLAPGATTQLTIRIDNPNVAAITTNANFDDLFPTIPGAMTLANGTVTNNTCSMVLADTNGVGLITPVGVGTDFSAINVDSRAGAVNLSMSGSFTGGCGANRLLLVVVELEANASANVITVNTATYGGQNLTTLYLTPSGVRNRIYVGFLKEAGIAAATGTTLTVTFTNAAAPTWAIMKAGYFTGVDQTNPFTASGGNLYVANFNDTAAGSFNFGATALTVVNNGRAMYFSMFNDNTTATPPTTAPNNFTELFDHTSSPGNQFSTEGGYEVITANGTRSGSNITLSSSERYGVVGLALQPITAYSGSGLGVRVPCGTIIPAGGCEFTVNVTATTAGVYTNTIAAGALQTNAGNNANAASATLVVPKLAPLVTKTFVPASINAGGTSTLLITLKNPNAVPISLTSLFTDTFPSSVVTAAIPNRATTCSGGTAGGTAGTVTLSSGAVIPSGSFSVPGSCTLQVDVTAAASGIYTNTIAAGGLQTTAGNNASAASAVLTVAAISPPSVSKAFGTTAIGNTNDKTSLTLTLTNTNQSTATLTANLDDNLPANLVIANPNGLTGTCTLGSVTATAGTGLIRYASGATIPAGGCVIVVNVTSSIAGIYTNTIAAGALQTNLGNSPGPTSDSLTVASDDLRITKIITGLSTPCNPGTCQIVYTITVTNVGSSNMTGVQVTDILPPVVLTYVSSSASQGSYNSGTGIWTVGTVNSGSSATLSITATVNDTSSPVLNCASLTASTPVDTNSANNTSCQSIVPTLVTLSEFRAYEDNGRVVVEWTTSSEYDTAGFYLYRLDNGTGDYIRINHKLLPALLTSSQGGTYSLIDKSASPDAGSLTYLIVEMEGKGSRNVYGPFNVYVDGESATGELNPDIDNLQLSGTCSHGACAKGRTKNASSEFTKSFDSSGNMFITNSKNGQTQRVQTDTGTDLFEGYMRKAHEMSGERKARLQTVQQKTKAARVAERRTTTGSAIKIAVREKGLYYLDASKIGGLLGISSAEAGNMIRKTNLAMSNQGKSVAYLPARDNAGIFFYGQGIDSKYTTDNIYWVIKAAGTKINSVAGRGPSPALNGTFTEKLHFEQDRFIAPAITQDPDIDYFFWEVVESDNPATCGEYCVKTFPVQANGVAVVPGSKAKLTAELFGFSDTPANPDHHIKIYMNNTLIGEDRWDGQQARTVSLEFDQALLNEAGNTIKLEGVLDTGAEYSYFYINSFDLEYQRLYRAVGNTLLLRADGNPVVTVTGFTEQNILVLEVTNPQRPKLHAGTTIDGTAGNYRVSFKPSGPNAEYLAVASGAAIADMKAWADSPSSLTSLRNTADYLIIIPEDLQEAATALAGYRQSKGLKTMIVRLEDIMDEFNYGISSPEAIRSFLSYAYRKWRTAPRYVALMGEGTYDYKDSLGKGDNLMPTMMAGTPMGVYPSDNLLADFNGDHIPEMAIGRFPLLTSGEFTPVLNKIKAYEAGTNKRIIMLADNPDSGGEFLTDSDDIAALVPFGYTVLKIYLTNPSQAVAVRQTLINEMNNGSMLLNYIGHAGLDRLAWEGLLRTVDLGSLTNGSAPPVLTAMTCDVGRFANPGYDSLSESLVLSNNGAVAVWAPTGLSFNNLAKVLDEGFFASAFRGNALLGDLILNAFQNYNFRGGPAYIMDIYNLQGDPALKMR